MVTYRTQVRIVADILSTARDYGNSDEGVGITLLLRRANLSYARLMRILRELVRSGLMVEIPQERGSRYRISERGIQFLIAYSRFEEFTQSYGLRI